jgi:acetoin utilization protein AcuC
MEHFHSGRYLDELQHAADGLVTPERLAMGLGTPDCPLFPGIYEYASWACGATLTAAELVLSGQADVAFNPSGGFHHAKREQAAGFCYANDVVLGCMRLAEAGRRILFLDVDAHHSDGVQEAFYERNDVMTISLHESGTTLFPGTGFENEIGKGAGLGYSVNVPLPADTYDEAYLRAFRAIVLPLVGAYDPDVVVVELGMDALAGDPLVHLSLTNNVHAEILKALLPFGKPILATGGGGYHVENTVRSWALAWKVLCGKDLDEDASYSLGGVMLESTDWAGGLRDRFRPVRPAQREAVDAALEATIRAVKRNVFGYHGLDKETP